jgi:hypothetical protein
MILLSLSLLLLSIFCEHKKYISLQLLLIVCLVLLWGNNHIASYAYAQDNSYTYNTPYSQVRVSERMDTASGEVVRDLSIDNVTHAGMYTQNNDLVYDYTRHYHLFDVFLPEAQNILML